MSTPPRRLRDDPDFLWETGCDLADEAFAVGGYDLPSMRAKVLAGTQPPSGGAPLRSPSGAMPWVVGAIGVALLLVGGAWFGAAPPVVLAPSVGEVVPSATGVGLPEERSTPSPVVEPPVVPAASANDGVAVAQVDAVPSRDMPDAMPDAMPRSHVASEPVAALPAPVEPTATSGEALIERSHGEAVPPPRGSDGTEGSEQLLADPLDGADASASTLAMELEVYERAADSLTAHAAGEAAEGFRAYLEAYPNGRLRSEATIGLLRALVEVGDAAAVEEIALTLLQRADLGSQRAEILRVRAENLVALERCDEALLLARSLSGRDAANVRRACRWNP